MHLAALNSRGFSLIELVIVLAIVGVIGAIAVPRLSTVSADAPMAAYKADLLTMQSAIERYTAEHVGLMPDKDRFARQLTQYTDIHGNVSAVKTNTHVYGPYLRKLPEAYISPRVTADEMADPDLSDGNVVDEVLVKSMTNKTTIWLYNTKTGRMRVKANVVDGGASLQASEAEAEVK